MNAEQCVTYSIPQTLAKSGKDRKLYSTKHGHICWASESSKNHDSFVWASFIEFNQRSTLNASCMT